MSIRQGDDIISGNGSGLPKQTGKAGKYLKTDGITVSWEDASTAQIWIGTKAEYDSLESYDDSIVYQIIDDYVDIKPINKNASRSIGELVYSTVPIIDAGLHLADGTLLDGDGLYNEFYEYMVSVYNNGHTSIFTTENIWQISINTYGKCGKYVLDTTNHTIRLPKLSGFIEGTLNESEIGDLVEAGLPNITGGLSIPATYGSASASGVVSVTNTGTTGSQNPVSKSGDLSITLNASRSSSIYGNSTTVQPESIKTYIYVVLANSIENIIELNVINELNNKADINLANTTAITNCITKIPQDIKLELNNGTLTLKAGSKVYVPNGAGVFDVANITTDKTFSNTRGTGQFIIMYNSSAGSVGSAVYPSDSGTSTPTVTQSYKLFYNTNDNKIYFDTGVWNSGYAFPIALVSAVNGVVTSIDQVFNGFGYIGSTVFALPGVKGLISDGRNPDGSLKNKSVTIQNVLTRTIPSNTGWHYITINKAGTNFDFATNFYSGDSLPSGALSYSRFYNTAENQIYVVVSGVLTQNPQLVPNFRIEHSGSTPYKITSMRQITPFHALDYNDKGTIVGWGMPDYTAGVPITTTAQTAPKNGWLIGSLWFSGNNVYFALEVNGIEVNHSPWSSGAWGVLNASIPIKAGQTYRCYGNGTMEQNHLYFYPNNE